MAGWSPEREAVDRAAQDLAAAYGLSLREAMARIRRVMESLSWPFRAAEAAEQRAARYEEALRRIASGETETGYGSRNVARAALDVSARISEQAPDTVSGDSGISAGSAPIKRSFRPQPVTEWPYGTAPQPAKDDPEDDYFCGSNYCDDPACTGEHPERL